MLPQRQASCGGSLIQSGAPRAVGAAPEKMTLSNGNAVIPLLSKKESAAQQFLSKPISFGLGGCSWSATGTTKTVACEDSQSSRDDGHQGR